MSALLYVALTVLVALAVPVAVKAHDWAYKQTRRLFERGEQ